MSSSRGFAELEDGKGLAFLGSAPSMSRAHVVLQPGGVWMCVGAWISLKIYPQQQLCPWTCCMHPQEAGSSSLRVQLSLGVEKNRT